MMKLISLLKNNFNRIVEKKSVIIMAFVVVPLMIGIGILFSNKSVITGNIALVSEKAKVHSVQQNMQNSIDKSISNSSKIKIDVMSKKPAMSKLLLGKYIAVAVQKTDGNYEITSIGNKNDKKIIEELFKTHKIEEGRQYKDDKRGTGTNILGFMMMIILMQGVALILLFTEDRDIKTLKRIMTGPVSERLYLFAQGIFTFLCLFIPTYAALVITKAALKVQIGFNYGMLALLTAILCALSTASALFIASVLEGEYSLAASGIYVITCVLSGCFISFTGNNIILDTICKVLPQKQYMAIAQGIENGKGTLQFRGQFIYLFIWIIALWLIGSIVTKRKMEA